MRNLQKLFMMLCIMGLMNSCGGGSNTPENVAVKFVKSFYQGDLNGMKKCMSKKVLEEVNSDESNKQAQQFLDAVKEQNKDAKGFKAIETTLSEDGNLATVQVEIQKGEDVTVEKVKMKKEDGKWVCETMSFK